MFEAFKNLIINVSKSLWILSRDAKGFNAGQKRKSPGKKTK